MELTTVMLGIVAAVQIATESLPISSSLHVQIAQWIVAFLSRTPEQGFALLHFPDFNAFMYVLHIPTAILCLAVFFKAWYKLVTGYNFAITDAVSGHWIVPSLKPLAIIAGANSVVVGMKLFADFISRYFEMHHIALEPHLQVLLFWSVLVGLLYAVQYFLRNVEGQRAYSWQWHHIFLFGLVESVAFFIPGFSRLGGMILALAIMGIRSTDIVSVAFLYAFPLFVAAGISGLPVMLQHSCYFSSFVLKNMIVGTILGYQALQFLRYSIEKKRSISFMVAYVRKVFFILALYFAI